MAEYLMKSQGIANEILELVTKIDEMRIKSIYKKRVYKEMYLKVTNTISPTLNVTY